MATGDETAERRYFTYSKSSIPILGALIDYLDTTYEYLRRKNFARAEQLHIKTSKASLSASFMAVVCLILGLVANVKFEVVTLDEAPLVNDLHLLLLSKDDHLYIDDVDVSRVRWCIEMSDLVAVLLSAVLVWNSKNVRSPLSEYLFLPWLGLTLRGLLLRQAPTAAALIYTMVIGSGDIHPLFLTAASLLFLLESRLWLEVARLVCVRWEDGHERNQAVDSRVERRTLWRVDDVQSVEVRSYVY